MRRVVMFSGGITSWATARWVADTYGTDDLVLLFADTLVEDEDLYRFNADAARDIGVPVTVVRDGRTPQQVGRDRRHLGNTQVANCSHLLKQAPSRAWLEANVDPADTTVYVGIDWSAETHRLPGITRNWAPWIVEAPLTRPPYRDKPGLIAELRARGIAEPRLYALGFAHNNCGGACVKAGQAQWAHLLRVFPDRFASWERHEQDMRAELGSDVAILRDRRDGVTRPLPLIALRQRIEASTPDGFDALDWGGCGMLRRGGGLMTRVVEQGPNMLHAYTGDVLVGTALCARGDFGVPPVWTVEVGDRGEHLTGKGAKAAARRLLLELAGQVTA